MEKERKKEKSGKIEGKEGKEKRREKEGLQ